MFISANSFIRAGALLALIALIPACGGTLNPNGSSNSNAPSFGGVTGSSPGPLSGEVTLSWSAALELNGGTITYLVFASPPTAGGASGSEDMSTPYAFTTVSTGITLQNLTSHDPYAFIVQAQDSAGATDGNMIETFATPP
jgi:hypothetical protein